MGLELRQIKKTDKDLVIMMSRHYSQPRGFVGRQLIYKVFYNNTLYGAIAGGSATLNLLNRSNYLPVGCQLNNIVNNTFFHVYKVDGKYPTRNFTSLVVKNWRNRVAIDWKSNYGDAVMMFETLVELPRTGDLYLKDSWFEIGVTKGFTCKRVSGKSTDSWSGRRVWDTKNLRPKRVLLRNIDL